MRFLQVLGPKSSTENVLSIDWAWIGMEVTLFPRLTLVGLFSIDWRSAQSNRHAQPRCSSVVKHYFRMYWTCKLEDVYSTNGCDMDAWPLVECDVTWKMTACAHEGRKYEENREGDVWTLPGNARFFFLCARDAYGNISKQIGGCISKATGEYVKVGEQDRNGSSCVKYPSGVVALLITQP